LEGLLCPGQYLGYGLYLSTSTANLPAWRPARQRIDATDDIPRWLTRIAFTRLVQRDVD